MLGKGIKFQYEYKGVSYEMIGRTLNYEKVVRIILHDYKEFIIKRFFK